MKRTLMIVGLAVFAAALGIAWAGPPFGRGPRHDPAFQRDREVFHFLLAHRGEITRKVTRLANGVETVTESEDPEVARMIREHVAAMHRRIKQGRPIHRRDPLFDMVFRHARLIEMEMEPTEQGIRVRETSEDAYTVKLIQEHARVVSLFLENGPAEVRRNHPPPRREEGR